MRLSDPSPEEVAVAERIEGSLELYDERNLGPRTPRDGLDGDLRVDFTYDTAAPPVALEITEIASPDAYALGSELRKLESHLNEIANNEQLGFWQLAVMKGSDTRDLEDPLLTLLRGEQSTRGPAVYSAAESPSHMAGKLLTSLRKLLDRGLVNALKLEEGHGVSIFPPIDDSGSVEGFGTLLRERIEVKREALAESRPRETHLAVWTSRTDISADPADTPPPQLPSEVDTLWVVLGYYTAKWDHRLWRTNRHDQRWQLLRHPLGEGPSIYPPD